MAAIACITQPCPAVPRTYSCKALQYPHSCHCSANSPGTTSQPTHGHWQDLNVIDGDNGMLWRTWQLTRGRPQPSLSIDHSAMYTHVAGLSQALSLTHSPEVAGLSQAPSLTQPPNRSLTLPSSPGHSPELAYSCSVPWHHGTHRSQCHVHTHGLCVVRPPVSISISKPHPNPNPASCEHFDPKPRLHLHQ